MWTTVCTTAGRVASICAEMASADVSEVSRKLATGGGTEAAIRAISSSAIGPGPEGIFATSPTASAPAATASRASSTEAMQQIFTRVRMPLPYIAALVAQTLV